MKDLTKLKELILEKVDLADTMTRYGIRFTFNPLHAEEVQFHCPFHGGGKDVKPSARLYKDTKSTWCWVCHKYRTVIDVVMLKEGLGYVEAIKFILAKWRLDTSSIPDAPSLDLPRKEDPSMTWVDLVRLKGAIRERRARVPVEKYAALVTAWYMTAYEHFREKPVAEKVSKLERKLENL